MAAECSSSCLFLVAFTFLPTFLRYVTTIKLKMTLLIYLNYQISQFKHMIWIRYRFVKFGNHWILFLFPNKPNSFTKIRKIKHKPTISVSITGSSCHSFSLPWQWFSKSLEVCCRNGTQFLQNTFPHLLFRWWFQRALSAPLECKDLRICRHCHSV